MSDNTNIECNSFEKLSPECIIKNEREQKTNSEDNNCLNENCTKQFHDKNINLPIKTMNASNNLEGEKNEEEKNNIEEKKNESQIEKRKAYLEKFGKCPTERNYSHEAMARL